MSKKIKDNDNAVIRCTRTTPVCANNHIVTGPTGPLDSGTTRLGSDPRGSFVKGEAGKEKRRQNRRHPAGR
ncbi:MAG TPA: hypothetical protein ENN40_06115 [Candidatus Aminicenantes bacterium]|nr:hypothetical protein [Candidatus Aminicenantes bacterium]